MTDEPRTWKCARCGKDNDGLFCSLCGEPAPEDEEQP